MTPRATQELGREFQDEPTSFPQEERDLLCGSSDSSSGRSLFYH